LNLTQLTTEQEFLKQLIKMGKLIVLFCFALLGMTLVMAVAPDCILPGRLCTSDDECCEPFVCNPWAGRCTGGPRGPGGQLQE